MRRVLATSIVVALLVGGLVLAGPPADSLRVGSARFLTPLGARVAEVRAGGSASPQGRALPSGALTTPQLEVGIAKAAFTPAGGDPESPLVPGELYQEGRVPWAEPFEDANGDGIYNWPEAEGGNGGDPERWTDLNLNGKWDGQWVSGFGSGTARGVHDDVWARAVVLRQNTTTVALVSVDAVGLFYEEVEKIRAALDPALEVDLVTVSSTHTHESSDTLGLWGPFGVDGKDPRTMAELRDAAVRAITDAASRLRPATVRGGVAPVQNLQSDGRYPYVIDRDVYALRFDDAVTGAAIGTLVNWSSHPEALWSHNLYISSDFPHWARERLEATYGGIAVYFSGSVGGIIGPGSGERTGSAPNAVIVPDAGGHPIVVPPWPGGDNQDAYEGQALRDQYRNYFTKLYDRTAGMGRLVAEAAENAITNGTALPVEFLEWKAQRLFIPLDNVFLFAYNAAGVFDRDLYVGGVKTNVEPKNVCDEAVTLPDGSKICARAEYSEFGQAGTDLLTEEDYVRIGSQIEIVTVPGELFPEIANGYGEYASFLDPPTNPDTEPFHAAHPDVPAEPVIRQAMRAPTLKLLFGLGNDELGYIVPANDFVPPSALPPYSRGVDQYDNRGGRGHYEETVSCCSRLAPAVARELVALIQGIEPAYWQGVHGGFLDASGHPQQTPGAATRGIWLNTSDANCVDSTRPAGDRCSGGAYEPREDTTVHIGSAYGGGTVGGFVDAQGRPQSAPDARTRGVWIDGDGNGIYTPWVDGVIMVDTWVVRDSGP